MLKEVYKTKYLTFIKYKKEHQITYTIDVSDKDNTSLLGYIKWYPNWRKYTFQTVEGIIFDDKCLEDIIVYIKDLMNERKGVKS